ncbi:MAG TPA: GspH/FimT family pseudopilin [Solimonas sp.]|nr:GspH/FimT family pseudopilin [Solimonas sp.]
MLPNRQRASGRAQRGLTIIELATVLAIIGILAAVAVPAMRAAVLTSQLRTVANSLLGSTLLARSEAIKRNSVAVVCRSTNGTTCAGGGDWIDGWIVGCPTNDNVNCVTGGVNLLVLQRETGFPNSLRVTEAAATGTLTFQPIGIGSTPAAFTVCRFNPVAGQERMVIVDVTGRASVQKTTNGVCP